MAIIVPAQQSGPRAWVEASLAVIREGGEGYNVMIEVTDPVTHDAQDVEVIKLVNTFLSERGCGANPISTVCNTIFPQGLLRRHGSPAFYEVYQQEVMRRLAKSKRWGRYFDRMTRKVDRKGQQYNPLDKIIDKLKKQNKAKTPYRAAYELTIYDPALDRKRYRDAPCLSYVSFKRRPDRSLSMTAVYRNQAYISKCLGNLIALGRLQAFVAGEAGLSLGTLTCLSTHAELDKSNRWGIKDARKLVQDAAAIFSTEVIRAGGR